MSDVSDLVASIRAQIETAKTDFGIVTEDGPMDKDKALEVGGRFLNACFSAWSCGEPAHRVRTMLDLADEFRAALDALEDDGDFQT